ncbi:TKL family protein kinase [Blastocystis sp. ATCC 50177/Nand II]|uniref:TKL family protein kinase n=1 Tax=Blastocystis sp. subtype 1 (strain ATCC 50177 / NandII) TaxID=478820 RepID=A0A196SB79_BLAHN|nr:TKL family protein kinase [Blastocystis sp. ATCC 50177/Nand II]
MSGGIEEKKSQKEIFAEACNVLQQYDLSVTSILINDLFSCIVGSQLVLDGFMMRQFESGSYVAIIRARVHSEYCQKDYYIPVSILYPISKVDSEIIRIFLIVTKNTTVNKMCSYINANNEILMDGIERWKWKDGLAPVVQSLRSYFSVACPIYEINPIDIVIPFSDLEVKEKLGEGASAIVYHGIYKGKDAALKRMKKIPTQVELRYLIREFQTQMRFKHECILEVYGHSEDPSGFPILVMELGGPSLEDLVIHKGVKFSNEVKKRFVLDIAQALEYLHSYNIVHRDIKMANVLVTNNRAKVADFGYAREIENNKSIEVSFCGSPAIMAPELIDSAKCSTKVDVYSFGCVLYELIGEKQCYYDTKIRSRIEFYQRVIAGLRPTLRAGMPREPCELMKRCWLADKQRPTMKEIVKVVEGWDTTRWERDVLTDAECTMTV